MAFAVHLIVFQSAQQWSSACSVAPFSSPYRHPCLEIIVRTYLLRLDDFLGLLIGLP